MNRSAPSSKYTSPAGERPAKAGPDAGLPSAPGPVRSFDPARAAEALKQARAS